MERESGLFLLEHHNAMGKGLNAVGLAMLLNPALAVAELTPISCERPAVLSNSRSTAIHALGAPCGPDSRY